MKKTLLSIVLLVACSAQAWSDSFLDHLQYYARAGYSLGGTAPIGMPATIRSLEKYYLKGNVTIGLDAYWALPKHWGLMGGLHFENKGMKIDARVKNYHMEIRKGSESLAGVFTGYVQTDVQQWMVTLPLQATYDLSSKVRLKLGPYFSYLASKSFSGAAYNGYLRQDDPTGPKVELGSEEGERGTYDFSDDMRKWQFGVDAGCDWYFSHRWGAFAGLTWGVSEVFKKDFHTIEQSLYSIYGTIGLIYQFK